MPETRPEPADPLPDARVLDALFATVAARKGADPAASYTARLFAKGRLKIAEKVGEEAVETVLAAAAQGRGEVVAESADLLYHLCVLWADVGITPGEVWAALAGRTGTSGLAEKAARRDGPAAPPPAIDSVRGES